MLCSQWCSYRAGLVVDFELVHAQSLDRKEIDGHLSVFEFPHTWAVYLNSNAKKAEGSAERITMLHRLKLEGGEWSTLLPVQPSESEAAFVNDVAASLELSMETITNLGVRMGSLLIDMDIVHPAE